MTNEERLNTNGLRFIAKAVRGGANPPGVPLLLDDAANLIDRLRGIVAKEATIQKAADELVHVDEYMYMDEGDIDGAEFAADCVYS